VAGFGEALRFVLYVGAANAAATPAQRAELRRRVRPLMEGYRASGHEGPVRAAIRDVMGAAWTPSEEWECGTTTGT
jgi:hypothetical protein